jgi:hypothetical protein
MSNQPPGNLPPSYRREFEALWAENRKLWNAIRTPQPAPVIAYQEIVFCYTGDLPGFAASPGWNPPGPITLTGMGVVTSSEGAPDLTINIRQGSTTIHTVFSGPWSVFDEQFRIDVDSSQPLYLEFVGTGLDTTASLRYMLNRRSLDD